MAAINRKSKQYMIAAVFTIILLIVDQVSKYVVVQNLKERPAYVIIRNVFQLEYLENRGAAFGIMQGQKIFFIVSALLITAVICCFFYKVPCDKRYLPLNICAVFILAGAWGNAIDRLRLGYVIDFFYFVLIDFPVFNVADIYLTVSVFILILLLLFYYKEEDIERILHSRKSRRRTD